MVCIFSFVFVKMENGSPAKKSEGGKKKAWLNVKNHARKVWHATLGHYKKPTNKSQKYRYSFTNVCSQLNENTGTLVACMFLLPAPLGCSRCIRVMPAPLACTCCQLPVHVPVACACCLLPLHAPVACSPLHAPGASSPCMFLVHARDACSLACWCCLLPSCMLVMPAPLACSCCMLVLHARVASSPCMLVLSVRVGCSLHSTLRGFHEGN